MKKDREQGVWCRGRESNPHGPKPTAPSRQRVCQFRHLGPSPMLGSLPFFVKVGIKSEPFRPGEVRREVEWGGSQAEGPVASAILLPRAPFV